MSDSDSFLDFPNSDSKKSDNLPSVKTERSIESNDNKVNETSLDDLFEKSSELSVPSNDETKVLSLNNKKNEISTDVRKPDLSDDKNDDNAAPVKKKSKAKKVLLWVGVSILGLIIGVVGFVIWYSNYLFSKIDFIDPDEVNQTIVNDSGETVRIADLTEPTQNVYIQEETIHNYLLIGIDSRSRKYTEDGTGGLSDVNMILSVDTKAGTIKLVSIARDSYANIPGYKNPAKINSAMSKGGPELLKSTVEQNLRLTIDGYAYVNFYNMAAVIDAVGGVYVDVTKSELYSENGLNDCLREVNQLYGLAGDYQQVNQTGHIWVNGRQAVAYSRIRYVGNGDYERSERQVEVLRSLLDQFMGLSVTGKASAIDDILSCISTNVSKEEITKYALEFLPSLSDIQIQYVQLPLKDCFNSGMYGGEWSIRPNWNAMIPVVQEFFYGECVEFDPVPEVKNAPSDDSCPDEFDLEEIMK
ncbi:MAG: LCP family protein [Clostridia bacterium]|nr:LCP family protein [Clostridia bacterium]